MGKRSSHTNPNILLYQVQQVLLLILFVLTILGALGLVVISMMMSAPLFFIMAGLMIVLSAPLLMGLVNSPPMSMSDEGLILQPFIGAERLIAWNEIERIEPYPLLPQANQEILKQYLIGRKKYRPADGIMLIVPTLPFPYRIAGVLSAEKGLPVIAVTNRTHRDYEQLKQGILSYATHTVQESLITEE